MSITYLKDSYTLQLIEYLQQLNEKATKKLDFTTIEKAIYYAQTYHEGQTRQSGEPFYSHPLAVAGMVDEYCFKTKVIAGAILHDIIEDTPCTLAILTHQFGDRIAQIVARLTRNKFNENKKSDIAQILNIAYVKGDKEVILIKLLDRLHNMQTIGCKAIEQQKAEAIDTLGYFVLFALYLGLSVLQDQLCELCHSIFEVPYSSDKVDWNNLIEVVQFLENEAHPNKTTSL